jgi:hypothetical protein
MPVANRLIITENVEHGLAKLEASKRISENVTVANITISAEQFFPVDDSPHVFGGKSFPLEIHEIGKRVFCPRLNNYFFEDNSASWPFIYGDIGQFLAGTASTEPLQNGRRLAVILDRYFNFRALEEGFDPRSSYIAYSEFVNDQCGDRHSGRDICTDFSGIGSPLGNSDGILKNLGLALHVSSLALDGSQGYVG